MSFKQEVEQYLEARKTYEEANKAMHEAAQAFHAAEQSLIGACGALGSYYVNLWDSKQYKHFPHMIAIQADAVTVTRLMEP